MMFAIGDKVRLLEGCGCSVKPDVPRGEHTFTEQQDDDMWKDWGRLELLDEGAEGVVVALHHWRIPGEEPVDNYLVEWPNGMTSILSDHLERVFLSTPPETV